MSGQTVAPFHGMRCPRCGAKTRGTKGRPKPWGRAIIRRRVCAAGCGFEQRSRETWQVSEVELLGLVESMFRKEKSSF